MMKESCEGFADNHDAVQAELECQLSNCELFNSNVSQVAVQEQSPLNNHAGGCEQQQQSQDASDGSEVSCDSNAASFANRVHMRDSDLVSLGNT